MLFRSFPTGDALRAFANREDYIAQSKATVNRPPAKPSEEAMRRLGLDAMFAQVFGS